MVIYKRIAQRCFNSALIVNLRIATRDQYKFCKVHVRVGIYTLTPWFNDCN